MEPSQNGRKWAMGILGFGVLLVALALAAVALFPMLIQNKVSQQVRLVKDGDTYKKWENIPIPILMKIYIFNVNNPVEIMKGALPQVSELGPYVYEQKRHKINVTIKEEEDKIEYQQLIYYTFRPDLSNGTEEDEISIANLPFIGMAAKLMKETKETFARIVIAKDEIDRKHPEERPFINRTVGEFLFKGYYVPFMATMSELKNEELLPNNTFGLYYGKNGTTKDWLEVYSGVKDNSKFGNIASFNGEPELTFWNDTYCNMINGSDGALFPPFVERDRRLNIFSPELCRSLYLTYDSDVILKGLEGYRFTLPKEVLEDPRNNSDNLCFCTDPGNEELDNCPGQGAYQLESCRKGAPIIVSLPHFLDGDEQYRANVEGMTPDRSKHETVITLEPTTGVLLEAKKRIQINLAVSPNKYFAGMKKMKKLVLPIVWVDESAELTVESAERIHSKLIKPQVIVGAGSWGFLGLGSLLICIAGLLIVRSRNSASSYRPKN